MKTKRTYAKRGSVVVPAFMVWYEGDDHVYFAHGKTKDKAKGQIFTRHQFVRGYTLLHARRIQALDDIPITYEKVKKLGFHLQNPEKVTKNTPICTCDLCKGGENGEKET